MALRGHRKLMLRHLPPDPEKTEAYDLHADPEEQRPLEVSRRDPELHWLYDRLTGHTEQARKRKPQRQRRLDPVHRSQLEALGYLQ